MDYGNIKKREEAIASSLPIFLVWLYTYRQLSF